MKLLVDKSLIHYATPVVFSGYSASQHNTDIMPTFDIFDSYEPDVYIADADLLNKTVYKAIDERPALRVCVVQKTREEHPNKKEFEQKFGNLYNWVYDDGYADPYLYNNPVFLKEYESDIVSMEANAESIDTPSSVIFRIFSNSLISDRRYCGLVPDQIKKNIFKSAKCSISEGNNFYNSVICDCYPFRISEFNIDKIYEDNSIKLKELKEEVLNSKTTFHLVSKILNEVGFEKESIKILNKMKELL